MFKNYLVTAFRNLRRHKALTCIYFAGLSVSIAASMLIIIWVNYQFSFDKGLKQAKNIYRVYPNILMNGNNFTSSMAPPPLSGLMEQEFPEVIAATRLYKYNTANITREDAGNDVKSFSEEMYQADSNFFQVFPFKMLQGDANSALAKPSTVVITKSIALKYFGKDDFEKGKVVGQKLNVHIGWWKLLCEVTGVTEDVPANAHFHYKIILSNISDQWAGSNVWVDNTYYTYALLKEGTNPQQLEEKLKAAVKPHVEPQLKTNFGTTYAEMKSNGSYWEYKLQPITDIHLKSHFERELEPGQSISSVYILSIAAIFLLIMACINYANLSTANAIKRSKEIGVRKTLGSSKWRIMGQVFTETGIISFISCLLALLLVIVFFKPFENLMRISIPMEFATGAFAIAAFIGLFFILSFFGGIYPAFYLSSFNVVKAIKGSLTPSKRFVNFKTVLVFVQFSMFIGIVVCALLIHRQLNYLRDKSPGFNKENVLVLTDAGANLAEKYAAFLEEVKKQSNILSANICRDYPGSGNDNFPIAANYRIGAQDFMIANFSAGYDFLKTFEMKVIEGRDFNRQMDNDTLKRIILNETAVKQLGITNPIGKIINTKYLNALEINTERYEVIGVVRDFNFKSLHNAIQPMGIFLSPWGQYFTIRISGGNVQQTIDNVKKVWEAFVPGKPFDFRFLDDSINSLYKTEAVLSNILAILTALIILVAMMGLAGLTLLIVQQRTKEIGIRKVVGASVTDIMTLISKEYIKWVLVSFIIAAPVAWLSMQKWLQGFAYRSNIPWWLFVIAVGSALLITIITISFQAVKAATANPVKALRSE